MHCAVLVQVLVEWEHFRDEVDLWWAMRIIGGERDVKEEDVVLVWRVSRANNCRSHKINALLVDSNVDRFGQILLQDFPLFHDTLLRVACDVACGAKIAKVVI